MKIKFVRNVAVHAVHREAGSVHEIADSIASLLISDGAAVRAAQEVETAVAPMASVETATIATKKVTRFKGK